MFKNKKTMKLCKVKEGKLETKKNYIIMCDKSKNSKNVLKYVK